MPKVTVIIPNYNHALFLDQRIQSILDQTYQNFEIIYLDDASTDNSNEVFARFSGSPKIREIINKTNSGSPFKQWNKGIKQANGEYIWIAESDDYADPFFLEALIPILDANSQVGLAYCHSLVADHKGNIKDTLHDWTNDLDSERWKHNFLNSGLDECKNYLALKNTIPNASAVLIRRSVFEAIGYAEESMFLCGDWMTWIKILLKSDIAFTAKALNYFRCHNSSVRSKSSQNGRDLYEKLQILYFVKQHLNLSQDTLESVRNQLISDWVALMFRKQSGISLARSAEFYKLAKNCDPSVEFQIVKCIGAYGLERVQHKVLNVTSV